ncbi:MAG TPA: thiamine phosphate synthase [Gemmatimonadales bacterium]|nr:thiamine phosphate synthase [Gemmatimonadales bacterium]
MPNNLAQHLRLMLVTDDRLLAGRDPVDLARQAVQGGVTAVQLRLKAMAPRELLALARRLRKAIEVLVIVNDRPDVAAAAGLGVHLGPDDLAVELAKRIMPPGTLIGASVGSADEARGALDADYWGVGPWRVTDTKADAGSSLGAEGFRRIVALSGGRPCLAIGGVRPEDVPAVLAAGGAGVAVVSGILGAADIEAAARRYAAMLA